MKQQPVFSSTVELDCGIFVTARARMEGLSGISVSFENPGTDLSGRKIPPEILTHLETGLSRVSSCLKGENNSLFGRSRMSDKLLLLSEVSDFRLRVWEKISEIPCGQTRTYSEIASALGGETRRRAVAQAVASNVFLILIPCHRVVGKNGFGGFSGEGGIEMKKTLLELESGAVN